MRFVLLSLLLTAVGACATMESGQAFDAGVASGFVVGTATRAQVEAGMGPATQVTENADGSSMLAYSHIVSRANGLTGKAEAQGSTAVFVFDANGVLKNRSLGSPGAKTR